MDINDNIQTFIKNYKTIFNMLDKFDNNDFKIIKECEYFDLSKKESLRTLRTHSHVFHLDEIAGLVILLMCNKIKNKMMIYH